MKSAIVTLTCLTLAAVGELSQAQTTYEDGPDGVRYRVTRSVVQRSIPQTEYKTHEQKVYRPQVTTEYQSYQQTYLTPVTQYQWEPQLRNWWSPFGNAYWTHELRPITRWEARPATVQIPVAKTSWVEETRTTQVPVTTYRTAQSEVVSREPIGTVATGGSTAPASSNATAIANRSVGGQQYHTDPPRSPSPWGATGTINR